MQQPKLAALFAFAFVGVASLLDMLSTYAACGVPGLMETNPFFDDACRVFDWKIIGLTLLLMSVLAAILFWVSRSPRLLCPTQHLVSLRAFWRWLLWGGGARRRKADFPSARAAWKFLVAGRHSPEVPVSLMLRNALLWGCVSFACARTAAALSNGLVLYADAPSIPASLGKLVETLFATFGYAGAALSTFAWGQALFILLALLVGQWLTCHLLRWTAHSQ